MPCTRSVQRRFLILAVCALALPSFGGVSPERLARLDAFLDAYVEEGRIPGAVLQVTHDDRTVYHRAAGFRDLAAGSPMQTDTIFRIASMSKAVVSAAVLMLQVLPLGIGGLGVREASLVFFLTAIGAPEEQAFSLGLLIGLLILLCSLPGLPAVLLGNRLFGRRRMTADPPETGEDRAEALV